MRPSDQVLPVSQRRKGYRPIAHSAIAAVAYSAESALDVEFTSGATYCYFAVAAQLFHEFLAAESEGRLLQLPHPALLSAQEAPRVIVEDHRYPITDASSISSRPHPRDGERSSRASTRSGGSSFRVLPL
jgi:hypothetical protein